MQQFFKKFSLPQTHYGFPIDSDPKSNLDEGICEETKKPKQKGVSILIAIMSISVMMTFIADLIVTSSVQLELSMATKDRVKAEYVAKSGANLAMFVLTISHAIDLVKGGPQAKQSVYDGPDSLWNVLNAIPMFGAQSVKMGQALAASKNDDDDPEADNEHDPLSLQGLLNEDIAAQMLLFEDQFTIKIEDELGKINVNGAVSAKLNVKDQLIRLFSCPIERAFLESKGLSPESLAYRIHDFISTQSSASPQSELDGKDDPYEKFIPPYKAKRLPFDSVDEIKLVEGWDDEVHAVFSPYLTVYPYISQSKVSNSAKININTAPTELISCLIPESLEASCREKFTQEMNKLRNKGETAPLSTSSASLKETLEKIACLQEDESSETKGVLPWFGVKSNIFRITVHAMTGSQEVQLEMVVQRFDPGGLDTITKKLKEKRPYRILYWRLI